MSYETVEQREKARLRRRRENLIFGIVMIVFAVAMAFVVIPAGVRVPASVTNLPLSPRFFPYVLTGLVFVFAAAFVVMTLFGPPPLPDDEEQPEARPLWPLRLAALAGILAAYALLSERLGMLPMAVLATLVLLVLGDERRPLVVATAGIVLPVVVYAFFTEVAQVPMPEGILPGWR
jgi:putative tricarboxylic transport membrane protein